MKFRKWKYKVTCDGYHWHAWYRQPFCPFWSERHTVENIPTRDKAAAVCLNHAHKRLLDYQAEVERGARRQVVHLGWLP